MRERKTRRVVVDLEGDAIVLFEALVALVKKRERETNKIGTTRDEVVGAIITAYVLNHERDIMESITDEAQRLLVTNALQSHRVRTGLPRSHCRTRGPRVPALPITGGAPAACVGDAAAPAVEADGSAAAE